MPSKTLFHWSRKPLDILITNSPKFEVRTQGRAWVIDKISKTKGATSRVPAASLVVFREQAAELFVRHPIIRWLGWKHFFGQYWSKSVYQDIVWNASDAFQCGRVLVVRKAEFVPIDDPIRLREQITRRRLIIAGDIAGAFLIVIMVVLAALAYDMLKPDVRDWLFAHMPETDWETSQILMRVAVCLLVGAIITIPIIIYFMKIVRKPNSDGSDWDVETEFGCAMKKADRAQAAEERRNSRELPAPRKANPPSAHH
ncbi:hypothetical protein EHI44_30430 [Rhizobium leguminosarum]|uniref:hypothetical protein n=1 Tax=Rhizobium leguminosarum TaxID=384 RepID=UPI000FF5DDF0|nr:hypothetical protein [Rhizobium leguminosarum]RWY80011.1 hypothetical protein EHI44_30430 [Rhizobium leguminosarum]